MGAKADLYLCMGSACHQYRVYKVLPQLQHLLREHGLEESIELKGAFCLGTCTDGVVLKFEEHLFYGISPENLEQKFKDEILGCLIAREQG